jgi:type VI secretion system protein ImpF
MPDIDPDQSLLPSILDRLIDFEPESRREAHRGRNQTLRELKLAVRRDLENLLNTRRRCVPWPPQLQELERSLMSYGIPDLTGASVGSAKERDEFRRTVQAIIARYERRLMKLNVRLVDVTESPDRAIRFQIDAVLWAEPAPEPIHFDSTLRLTTGTFEVT